MAMLLIKRKLQDGVLIADLSHFFHHMIKKYGEYFTSINTRASSILGINYEDPKI